MSRAACEHCGYVPDSDPTAMCPASDASEPLHCETSAADVGSRNPPASTAAQPVAGHGGDDRQLFAPGSCMLCDDNGDDEHGFPCQVCNRAHDRMVHE